MKLMIKLYYMFSLLFTAYFIMNKTDSLTEVRKALPENWQCEIIFNGAGKLILLTVYEFEN